MAEQIRFDGGQGFDGVVLIYAGRSIHVDADGYMDLTELFAADTRDIDTYLKAAKTKRMREKFEKTREIAAFKVGRGRGHHTWAHPFMAQHAAYWLSLDAQFWVMQQLELIRERMARNEFWSHMLPGRPIVDALDVGEPPELEQIPPGDLEQPDVDSFTERVWGPDVDEMIRAESSNKYAALERLITDLERLAALKESSRRWELTGFAQPVQIEPRRLHYPEDHDDTQDGPMVRCPCYKPIPPPRRHAKSPTECEIHQPPMGLFHLAAHIRGEHAKRFERFCLFCRAGDS